MSYELWISLRYLKAKRKQTFISVISVISIAGVALGVMALIIVLAVMSGFEGELRNKILGTNSHIVILRHGKTAIEDYPKVIEDVLKVEQVAAASPFVYTQAILTSEENVLGVALRGIDPKTEPQVNDLGKNITDGSLAELGGSISGQLGIALGEELSRSLGAFYGDTINLVFPSGALTPMGVAPQVRQMRVAAVFTSGMYEYDSGLAYVSLKTAQELFRMGDRITGISVKVTDIYQAEAVARKIQAALGFPFWVRGWMEMNRSLFSALELEKLAMFIILTLIVVVAAFGIISTLTMMVMEKHRDIAILKSMGAASRSIMKVFMLEGIIIGFIGTVLGGVSGTLICWLADKYKIISLRGDIYYMTHLPFKMQPLEVSLIIAASLLISFLATIYPAWQAARQDPAVALRYE